MTDPLDLRGLQCPLVVLKIRRAMAAVPPGGTLVALADDPMALVDVPVMCHHMRFALRDATQADGRIHFVIEKPRGWTKPADRGPMK
jgi:tRNA 2-thiouridine synthesizing protein A